MISQHLHQCQLYMYKHYPSGYRILQSVEDGKDNACRGHNPLDTKIIMLIYTEGELDRTV